ncbi:hypothetical protein BGZ63DRAFT_136907 [Mariannaea sp. PMI_226]|nr:hypothetical protein BGZ63DRAFT_136907 [Mariannaea sp. PMI_226]
MPCFCHKLLTRQYHSITKSETEILKRTSAEAPHLFQARKRSASGLAPGRQRTQVQPVRATLSLSPTAADLIRTYSSQNALKVFGEGGNRLDIQQGGSSGVFVRIFLVIGRSDQKIEVQQIFRRACCYAFAQLHKKGTSVDPIVQEIENALPLARDTRQKVYNILRIGTKWVTILETFASILDCAPQQLTGLLCVLGSAST